MFSASRAHEGVEEKASINVELALPAAFKKKAAGSHSSLQSKAEYGSIYIFCLSLLGSRLALFLS